MPQNPFTADIYPDGYPADEAQGVVHQRELDHLMRMAADAGSPANPAAPDSQDHGGRVVLLRAPRAGFGKSHLLEVLRRKLAPDAYVSLVTYDPEKELRWGALLWEVIERFHETPVGTGPWTLTLLDDLARRTFALLNVQMIAEGRVPCANPDAAIAALQQRYLELFDLNDPAQPVGKWFADHFERLMGVTSTLLAARAGMRPDAAAAWLRVLCGYSQGIIDGPAVRFESLRWALHQGANPSISAGGMSMTQAPAVGEAFYKEKLAEFGRIAGLGRPLVLVFDHLDMIHGSAPLTLRVAGVIAELRRLLPRSLIVFSTNQDLWANTFQKFLPSALEDRLSGGEVTLGGLGRVEAESLVRHRLQQAGVPAEDGEYFLARLNLPALFVRESGRIVSPRSLLRHAARAWDDMQMASAEDSAAVAPLRVEDAALFAGFSPPLPAGNGSIASPAPGPASASSSATPASVTPASQFNGMLDALRQQRLAAGQISPFTPVAPGAGAVSPFSPVAPPPSSGVVLRDPTPPAHHPSPPPIAAPPTDPLLGKFAAIRLRLLQARVLRIDQDRLCHLLDVGGQRLAVVRPGAITLPGGYAPGAIVWQSPDGEIYFGTEPQEDTGYWQSLMQLVREKHQASAATGQPPPRLVVFSSAQDPTQLTDWLPAESAAAAQAFVDLVTLDQESLSSIYAADELLHEIESGTMAATADEVLTRLSAHLDSFWKRLTRPKRAATAAS